MNDSLKKVLLATDGSPDSLLAARKALELAHVFGSELHVVHVVPVSQPYHIVGAKDFEGPSFYEEDVEQAQKLLDEQVKQIEEAGGKVAKAYLRSGEPDAEVISLGEEIGADLIVVGSRGLNPLRRLPVGSVSSSIVAHAHCPVLVTRGEEKDTNHPVVQKQERVSG